MAVSSPSPRKNHKVTNNKTKRGRNDEAEHENENEMVIQASSPGDQSPPRNHMRKRAKNRGIRVVGARIYDSQNGKSCHQCRQKTMDFVAECTKIKDSGKPCTRKCCFKCLENRYGENAEKMQALGTWICPSCRGICNCSQCMLKKGHKPTGIMAPTAKKAGFSVSQMLQAPDFENLCSGKTIKNETGLAEERVPDKEHDKESSSGGTCDPNLQSQPLLPRPDVKKHKKVNKGGDSTRKGNQTQCSSEEPPSTKTNEENMDASNHNVPSDKQFEDFVPASVSDPVTKQKGNQTQVISEKPPNTKRNEKNRDACSHIAPSDKQSEDFASTIVSDQVAKDNKKQKRSAGQMDVQVKRGKTEKDNDMAKRQNGNDVPKEVILPQGTELTNLAGIDLSPEDVGYALQFLEFCAAFGEILGIKKGKAESVLRDVMSRRGRRGKCSSHVQIYIQLLTLILKECGEESPSLSTSDDESSWLLALKNYLAEYDCALKEMPVDFLDQGSEGYERLSSSEKLRLLIFLCDETLCTTEMRDWIAEQDSQFEENKKEAREKLKEAKDKVKAMKQKQQDEIAKAILAKTDAPLSVSDYQSIVSEIKAESAKAHAEMMDTMKTVPNYKSRSDAVRTDPIFLSSKGHAFWKLKAYDQSVILLQDLGGQDLTVSNDKWFSFNEDVKKDVEKYISSSRLESK